MSCLQAKLELIRRESNLSINDVERLPENVKEKSERFLLTDNSKIMEVMRGDVGDAFLLLAKSHDFFIFSEESLTYSAILDSNYHKGAIRMECSTLSDKIVIYYRGDMDTMPGGGGSYTTQHVGDLIAESLEEEGVDYKWNGSSSKTIKIPI